ncbi:hypothetical protein [Nocardiopsis trehalosi]|uniref:hypothetical protein n=1 Tax=Nocardiopsis trehalosi TaxID=109329 RepID=UPI000AD81AD8|nr:hypothetical protein [Nocardiopsis trehalosi]
MTLTARTATLAAVLAATTLLTAHAQAIDLSSLPVVGSLLGGAAATPPRRPPTPSRTRSTTRPDRSTRIP